jgi:hypothetical protein
MLRRATTLLTVLALLTASLAPLSVEAAAGKSQKQGRGSKVAPEPSGSAAVSSHSVRVIIQTKGRPTQAHEGIVVGSGIMLGDGFIWGDGIMLSDGMMLGDGIMISD